MTAVTACWCIGVAADSSVVTVRCRFSVAIGRACENYIIRGIDMAIRALRAVVRNLEEIVIKGGSQPRSGGMACRAGCRISGALMVRIACSVIVRCVAAIAIGRHGRKVIVHVATGAGHSYVETG